MDADSSGWISISNSAHLVKFCLFSWITIFLLLYVRYNRKDLQIGHPASKPSALVTLTLSSRQRGSIKDLVADKLTHMA